MPSHIRHTPERQYAIVARAIDFVRANVHRQPSLAEVAGAVSLSEYHLQRLFSQWAGLSPKRFLQYLTKEQAKKRLLDSQDILSASLGVGLSGPGRLHDLMVSCEGLTPGEIKALGHGVDMGHGRAATPFGDALIGWTARGICFLAFCDGDEEGRVRELAGQWPAARISRDDREAERIAALLFPATPRPGKLHLVLRGTNFQIKVWEALLQTRPPQLISYGRLAALAGSPGAQRAVGSALAANPIGYLIPCHRVIRETGEISNYRWGSGRKLALIAWEGAQGDMADRPDRP